MCLCTFPVKPLSDFSSFRRHVGIVSYCFLQKGYFCLSHCGYLKFCVQIAHLLVYIRTHLMFEFRIQQSLKAEAVECASCHSAVFYLQVSRKSCFAREIGFWQADLENLIRDNRVGSSQLTRSLPAHILYAVTVINILHDSHNIVQSSRKPAFAIAPYNN